MSDIDEQRIREIIREELLAFERQISDWIREQTALGSGNQVLESVAERDEHYLAFIAKTLGSH